MKEVSLNTTRQAQGPQKAAQAQAQPTAGVGMVAPVSYTHLTLPTKA